MYHSILVPVDGSEYSEKALKVACQLAESSHTVLYLLNVPEMPLATDALGMAAGAPSLEISRIEVEQAGYNLINQIKNAEQEGHNLVERITSAIGLIDVELKTIVKMGSPASIIVEEASELGVEAIVMGSRGMSDFKSLILGSISHKVMHTANCTVITVH